MFNVPNCAEMRLNTTFIQIRKSYSTLYN